MVCHGMAPWPDGRRKCVAKLRCLVNRESALYLAVRVLSFVLTISCIHVMASPRRGWGYVSCFNFRGQASGSGRPVIPARSSGGINCQAHKHDRPF